MLATRVGRYHPYDEQIFNYGCLVDYSMLRLVDWFLHAALGWLNPTCCGCLVDSVGILVGKPLGRSGDQVGIVQVQR